MVSNIGKKKRTLVILIYNERKKNNIRLNVEYVAKLYIIPRINSIQMLPLYKYLTKKEGGGERERSGEIKNRLLKKFYYLQTRSPGTGGQVLLVSERVIINIAPYIKCSPVGIESGKELSYFFLSDRRM